MHVCVCACVCEINFMLGTTSLNGQQVSLLYENSTNIEVGSSVQQNSTDFQIDAFVSRFCDTESKLHECMRDDILLTDSYICLYSCPYVETGARTKSQP